MVEVTAGKTTMIVLAHLVVADPVTLEFVFRGPRATRRWSQPFTWPALFLLMLILVPVRVG